MLRGQQRRTTGLQRAPEPAGVPVPLAAVVAAVRQDLAPLLAATQGQLAVVIAPGLRGALAERSLRLLVTTLLSNAFTYHRAGRRPQVRLRACAPGRRRALPCSKCRTTAWAST